METVSYQCDGSIATITLNRPQSLNAMNQTLRLELMQVLRQAGNNTDIQAVVITATGKAFCAGADVAQTDNTTPGEIERQLNEEYAPFICAIEQMPKPVICVVQGTVAGGGCVFPLLADVTLMAAEASLYPAFNAIGLVPDCGVTWLLQKQLGTRKTYELSLQNRKISANECLTLGLVNKVAPKAELGAATKQWIKTILKSAPRVPRELKRLLREVPEMSLHQAITHEAAIQDELVNSKESQQRIKAFLQAAPT